MAAHKLRTISKSEDASFIIERNTDISLPDGSVLRANVYRPLDTPASDESAASEKARYPVLMTYGPYGKDVPYPVFNPHSWAGMHPAGRGEDASWETPLPGLWTAAGYVVVRVDERGFGQSPGRAAVLSGQTWRDFAVAIEWAADQPWSTGKVALLGISYYAITQWAAAALRPKGLAAIIPWEGACDIYREAGRHGGILNNAFIEVWWNRQVASNIYGLPGRAARNWGPDTIEGDIPDAEREKNVVSLVEAMRSASYADEPFYLDSVINVENIQTPLLSVANWGGTGLHPRGNVQGYLRAGSSHKWLFFLTGRHDLPFYRDECVALQRSFLDAFCKGEDSRGWLKGPNADGGVPAVRLVVRSPGKFGVDDEPKDRSLSVRSEPEWPLRGTEYTAFYITPDKSLARTAPATSATFEYAGFTGDAIQFTTPPFEVQTEVTGHPLVHLYASLSAFSGKKDLDVFVSLRVYGADGVEASYTGTFGQPICAGKGWLRASSRAIDASHELHRTWLPYRPGTSTSVAYLQPEEIVELVVEVWPVHFVLEKGARLVLEIAPHDTPGTDIFRSNDPQDRNEETFGGVMNRFHVAKEYPSRLVIPIVPAAGAAQEKQW